MNTFVKQDLTGKYVLVAPTATNGIYQGYVIKEDPYGAVSSYRVRVRHNKLISKGWQDFIHAGSWIAKTVLYKGALVGFEECDAQLSAQYNSSAGHRVMVSSTVSYAKYYGNANLSIIYTRNSVYICRGNVMPNDQSIYIGEE